MITQGRELKSNAETAKQTKFCMARILDIKAEKISDLSAQRVLDAFEVKSPDEIPHDKRFELFVHLLPAFENDEADHLKSGLLVSLWKQLTKKKGDVSFNDFFDNEIKQHLPPRGKLNPHKARMLEEVISLYLIAQEIDLCTQMSTHQIKLDGFLQSIAEHETIFDTESKKLSAEANLRLQQCGAFVPKDEKEKACVKTFRETCEASTAEFKDALAIDSAAYTQKLQEEKAAIHDKCEEKLRIPRKRLKALQTELTKDQITQRETLLARAREIKNSLATSLPAITKTKTIATPPNVFNDFDKRKADLTAIAEDFAQEAKQLKNTTIERIKPALQTLSAEAKRFFKPNASSTSNLEQVTQTIRSQYSVYSSPWVRLSGFATQLFNQRVLDVKTEFSRVKNAHQKVDSLISTADETYHNSKSAQYAAKDLDTQQIAVTSTVDKTIEELQAINIKTYRETITAEKQALQTFHSQLEQARQEKVNEQAALSAQCDAIIRQLSSAERKLSSEIINGFSPAPQPMASVVVQRRNATDLQPSPPPAEQKSQSRLSPKGWGSLSALSGTGSFGAAGAAVYLGFTVSNPLGWCVGLGTLGLALLLGTGYCVYKAVKTSRARAKVSTETQVTDTKAISSKEKRIVKAEKRHGQQLATQLLEQDQRLKEQQVLSTHRQLARVFGIVPKFSSDKAPEVNEFQIVAKNQRLKEGFKIIKQANQFFIKEGSKSSLRHINNEKDFEQYLEPRRG